MLRGKQRREREEGRQRWERGELEGGDRGGRERGKVEWGERGKLRGETAVEMREG